MTEMAKTVLFVGAALAALMLAFAMGPTTESDYVEELIGSKLNKFDVDVAKRLKIVKFDTETAQKREFEVAEQDGLWTIPSKQGYPADAAQQMAEAVTCLIDREVLRVAAKSAVDHQELGVVDPSGSKLDSKAEGVGVRVTITDSNDNALTDMIIGKEVKDADGQYYVRNADQDVVYVVMLDPDKLSTTFDDWIEDDLLKLNPMDIRQVKLEDYSAELQLMMTNNGFERGVAWDRRGNLVLDYDPAESKWQASQVQKFDGETKQFVADPLAEDEQVDEDTMRELRNGLDDLLLVDVERKPSGLSSDLKASSDFLTDREAIESLQQRGFIPIGRDDAGAAEIISSEGETICTLSDGVEYVLRFGNLQLDSAGGEAKQDENAADNEADDEESDDGIHRYLFVMARFNESMIEAPELEDLPELPADTAEAAEEEVAEDGGETASDADTEAEETTAEAAATEGDATEEAAETDEDAATTGEAEAGETASDADEDAEASTEGEAESDDDSELADLIAERKAIETENQRKLDEYQDKIKEGKQRVTELNERFGDWYYVISNDVYKKIHLTRSDVITTKKAETEDSATDAPAAGGGLPGLPNLPIGGPGN